MIHIAEQEILFKQEYNNINLNLGKNMTAMEGRLDRVIEIDLSVKLGEENAEGDEDSVLDFNEKIKSSLVHKF